MDTVERVLLSLALEECQGNQMAAARKLGLHRNTICRKIRQYKIGRRR
ncbi:MAG: helix-turn-helix domain-containing protein [Alphaproteobacteria bacterium]